VADRIVGRKKDPDPALEPAVVEAETEAENEEEPETNENLDVLVRVLALAHPQTALDEVGAVVLVHLLARVPDPEIDVIVGVVRRERRRVVKLCLLVSVR